jgi:hypothetical protein
VTELGSLKAEIMLDCLEATNRFCILHVGTNGRVLWGRYPPNEELYPRSAVEKRDMRREHRHLHSLKAEIKCT